MRDELLRSSVPRTEDDDSKRLGQIEELKRDRAKNAVEVSEKIAKPEAAKEMEKATNLERTKEKEKETQNTIRVH